MNIANFCKNSEIILSRLWCFNFIFLVCAVSSLNYCSLHVLTPKSTDVQPATQAPKEMLRSFQIS